MGGIYNPGESIIQNYLRARALRHQFEQDKLQQQNIETDRKERIHQFEETMKRYEEDRKLRQQANDLASKQLELQVRDAIAAGKITPNVGDIPVFEELNRLAGAYPSIPQTKLTDATALGFQVPYGELPKITLPELKQLEWQSEFDKALSVAEANAKARAEVRAAQDKAALERAQLQSKTSKENTADLIKSREKVAGMRLAQSANETSVTSRVLRKNVLDLIGQLDRDQRLARFMHLDEAQKVINSAGPSGISDTTLLYQFIKSQDDSVVREGEMNLFKANMPYLKRFRIGLDKVQAGVENPSVKFLTNADRELMKRQIAARWEARQGYASGAIDAMRNRIKFLDSSLDDATIDKLLKGSVGMVQGNILQEGEALGRVVK